MSVEENIEQLRNMNHLIEIEHENLPPLENEHKWYRGWIRFHDVMTNALICINESDTTDEENQIGEILVCSGMYYSNSVCISAKNAQKYLLAEQMKSNMLIANNKKLMLHL
jgi:hypothetical protein